MNNINFTYFKKALLVYLFVALAVQTIQAQDPEFSQFYAAPIYTNPAFTGASKKLRINGSTRIQNTILKEKYQTSLLSVDAYVPFWYGGLGVMILADKAGSTNLTNTALSGIYSYNVDLNKKLALNLGLQGSFVQSGYDETRLIFPDMLDKKLGAVLQTQEHFISNQKNYFNFATGFLLYNEKIFGGMAVHNLFEPNQSFVNLDGASAELVLPRRYTAHLGLNFEAVRTRNPAEQVFLSPNVLFMKQQNFYQVNLGLYIRDKNLLLGGWMRQTSRNLDSYILMLGFRKPAFKCIYSIDFVNTKSTAGLNLSHELSMGFEITNYIKKRRYYRGRKIKDPSF
jgi:type IX secretion system PorP/SprF family membrane protein